MKLVLVAIAACVAPVVASAQVYKCVEGGKMVFSDIPCTTGAERVNLRTAQPSSAEQAAAQARAEKEISEVKLKELRAQQEAEARAAYERENGEPSRADECAAIKAKRAEALEWSRRFKHPDNVNRELEKAKQYDNRYFSRCYGSMNGNY